MPIAFTAGGKDDIVPAASVVRLAQSLETRKAKVLLLYRPEGGHATTYDDATTALDFVIEAAERGGHRGIRPNP